MGFASSFVAWMLLIFFIALIVFTIFNYILAPFFPKQEPSIKLKPEVESESDTNISTESSEKSRTNISTESSEKSRTNGKIVGMFIIAMLLIIMTTGGINAYIDTRE